jgi:hypothetical protein
MHTTPCIVSEDGVGACMPDMILCHAYQNSVPVSVYDFVPTTVQSIYTTGEMYLAILLRAWCR